MSRYEYLNETRKLLESQLRLAKKPEHVIKLTVWITRIEDEMLTLAMEKAKAS